MTGDAEFAPSDLPSEELESVCQSRARLYTFLKLEDQEPKHIAQDLDLTRSAIQFYIDDWKEHELIYTQGKQYRYTEKGRELYTGLLDLIGILED